MNTSANLPIGLQQSLHSSSTPISRYIGVHAVIGPIMTTVPYAICVSKKLPQIICGDDYKKLNAKKQIACKVNINLKAKRTLKQH